MDPARYIVREFRESDIEPYAVLRTAIFPEDPIAASTFRGEWELAIAHPDPLPWFSVEERSSGKVVAAGGLVRNPFQDDPARPWAFADVHPEHVHHGIGSALYATALAVAQRRGATGLRCSVHSERPSDLAFLTHRGFVERRRSWISVLDLAHAETSRLPELVAKLSREGLHLTTLTREGETREEVQRGIYELGNVTGADVPRVGAFTPPSFEEYRRLQFSGPNYLPEAWMLAKEGTRYVGVSSAGREPAEPGMLRQWYTATRPEYRGRQVAETLKLMLIEYARRSGYARITTSNDSVNQPMWSLNQRLGFRKFSERIHTEKLFDADR
ncbi:MAG: GNAT family N-acetyltransferase [Thermoplasmata archaeon]